MAFIVITEVSVHVAEDEAGVIVKAPAHSSFAGAWPFANKVENKFRISKNPNIEILFFGGISFD